MGQLRAQPCPSAIPFHEQQCSGGGQGALINAQCAADTAGDSAGQDTTLKKAIDRVWRGIPGLQADDTPVAVSLEIWFDLINNIKQEPHKNKIRKKEGFVPNLSIANPPVIDPHEKVIDPAVNRKARPKYA